MDTLKQKAIRLIEEKGCSYEFVKAHYPDWDTEISVFPPDGYAMNGLKLGIVCHSWKEVIEILSDPHIEILPIEEGG